MKKNIAKKLAATLGISLGLLMMGCETTRNVMISYQVDENKPVKSAAKTVPEKVEISNKIDFDANPRQTLVGLLTGNDVKKARGNSMVEVYGELAEQAKRPNKKNKVFDTNTSTTKKSSYIWDGYVIWRNMKVNSRISFKTTKKDGKYNFTVLIMDCGDISMKVLIDFGNKTGVVPLKVFTSTNGKETYDVYLTQDKNYVAFGADSNKPDLVEKYTPKSTTREMFNLKGQILQIVDSTGNVVAQVEKDKYSLYIPESDERTPSIMQTVGMIGTYMGIIDTMD